MAPVKTERIIQALIVVCFAALVWVIAGIFQERIVVAGDSAPRFSVTTEDGRTISPSNFGGKLLVVHFWATWCPPCVTETPSLNQFQQAYAKDGVVVLGISVDTNAKAYRDFLQRHKIAFATSRDPDAKIASDYGTFQYPETYIINRDGKVLEKIISNTEWMDPERQNVIRAMLGS
ncbi:MAG TPA: TlpA disulfide reductase family protein [Bryobacteraceae bacterium]|nr:TlpA disulfide reductase family protein [Bryobacteraceae bacterium]